MRLNANNFLTTSLVALTALAAGQARAADVAASSAVDAVTVYPDGASVTRIISLDLPAGENFAVLKDFPLDAGSVIAAGSRAKRAQNSRSARSTQSRRVRRRRSTCPNSTSVSRR